MTYWKILEEFITTNRIIIDRPKGSAHPVFNELLYPTDYGFIENTKSMDGTGIDVFVGSKEEKKIEGIICVADKTRLDSEIKIIYGCSDKEVNTILDFLNKSEFMKAIFIARID